MRNPLPAGEGNQDGSELPQQREAGREPRHGGEPPDDRQPPVGHLQRDRHRKDAAYNIGRRKSVPDNRASES